MRCNKCLWRPELAFWIDGSGRFCPECHAHYPPPWWGQVLGAIGWVVLAPDRWAEAHHHRKLDRAYPANPYGNGRAHLDCMDGKLSRADLDYVRHRVEQAQWAAVRALAELTGQWVRVKPDAQDMDPFTLGRVGRVVEGGTLEPNYRPPESELPHFTWWPTLVRVQLQGEDAPVSLWLHDLEILGFNPYPPNPRLRNTVG